MQNITFELMGDVASQSIGISAQNSMLQFSLHALPQYQQAASFSGGISPIEL